MTEGDKPVEMVHKSYLKCAIYNKTDGTKDDALYEDFLSEGAAETESVADNDGYTDYYYDDDSPAMHDISDYDWASFFVDDFFWRDFNHITSEKLTSTFMVAI